MTHRATTTPAPLAEHPPSLHPLLADVPAATGAPTLPANFRVAATVRLLQLHTRVVEIDAELIAAMDELSLEREQHNAARRRAVHLFSQNDDTVKPAYLDPGVRAAYVQAQTAEERARHVEAERTRERLAREQRAVVEEIKSLRTILGSLEGGV